MLVSLCKINMKKMKTTWIWYWGIDQNNPKQRSADHVFTDFDKMKKHLSQHSFEHQWIGKGYWSNYDKVDKVDNEWVKLENVEEIKGIIKKSTPFHTENTTPVATEFYLINSNVIKYTYVNVDSAQCEYDENLHILSTPTVIIPKQVTEVWTELFDNEYDKVKDFCEPLHPSSQNNSLHIYEEIYQVNCAKYRFLYSISSSNRDNPVIEKSNLVD